jgi:hypothetical protein
MNFPDHIQILDDCSPLLNFFLICFSIETDELMRKWENYWKWGSILIIRTFWNKTMIIRLHIPDRMNNFEKKFGTNSQHQIRYELSSI